MDRVTASGSRRGLSFTAARMLPVDVLAAEAVADPDLEYPISGDAIALSEGKR